MLCRAVSIRGFNCRNKAVWKGFCQHHAKLDTETKLPQRKTFYLQSGPLNLNEIKEYFLNKGFRCEVIDLDPKTELEESYVLVIRGGLRYYTKMREFENRIDLVQSRLKEDLNVDTKESSEDEATIRIHLGSPDVLTLRWYRKTKSSTKIEIYNGDITFLFPPKNLELIVKSISEN